MDKKMISISIKDVHQMRKLFIAADINVLFYEHKFSQSLLNIDDVMKAFKDDAFTGYELRYWPDTEYMQLIENYKADGVPWGDTYTAYSGERGAVKDLFIKLLPVLTSAELYIDGKKI